MGGAKTNALILAAGLGTRLRPLTDRIPKCLVPVDGQPLLGFWVDRLLEAGVRRATINTHSQAELVRDYLDSVNTRARIHLSEAFEPELLGSAGTVAANADLADDADTIILIYADNFSTVDLRRMLEFHRQHDDPFTMLLFHAPKPSACGIAELDDDQRVVSFVEKPKEPKSDLANAGVYIVDASAYREIAAMKAFDLGFEVLPKFAGRMRGWIWNGYHLDIGTYEALAKARNDAPTRLPNRSKPRPAVFFDRDGTLIEEKHYLSDPGDVRLLPGAAESICRLRAAGYVCVIVTNQSGIGRGYFTETRLHEVHEELNRQLAAQGAELDAIYYCPQAPAGNDRTAIEHPDRKPGPGMLLKAADDLNLDLGASWMVGDMISDLLAGINARCRGSILVRTGLGLSPHDQRVELAYKAADNLPSATDMILRYGAEAGVGQPHFPLRNDKVRIHAGSN